MFFIGAQKGRCQAEGDLDIAHSAATQIQVEGDLHRIGRSGKNLADCRSLYRHHLGFFNTQNRISKGSWSVCGSARHCPDRDVAGKQAKSY